MSKSYEFILDPTKVIAFGDKVLKPLAENQVYMVFLAARNKYLTDEQRKTVKLAGQDMIARKVLKKKEGETTGQMLLKGLSTLCVPAGHYRDNGGNPIPFNAFTMFVTVNPRDCKKASLAVAHTLLDKLANDMDGFQHLENLVLSSIHKEVSRKVYLDLDIDLKVPMDLAERLRVLDEVMMPSGNTPFTQVNTRGGYHLLVEYDQIDKERKNTFYLDLMKLSEMEKNYELEVKTDGSSGAVMTPIPGTSQGGYEPTFLEKLP